MTQEYLKRIVDEFEDLKAQIETYKYYELDNLYCIADEFEDEYCELDVTDESMPDAIIQMVYVDRNEDDSCTVCPENVTIRKEGSEWKNEQVNLKKYINK